MMRRAVPILVLATLVGPGAADGAPTLSDAALSPGSWSPLRQAGAMWAQSGFGAGLPGPARVQVNRRPDGSGDGDWETRAVVDGPLVDGVRSAELAVPDLEGRHRVRLLVDGAANSPFDLGVLRLDRRPPIAAFASLTPEGGPIVADWMQSDALAGTDPDQPTVVEVNADPGARTDGGWVPFAQQPKPGDGRRVARTDLVGLPDGQHLVRVRMRDRAGNVGVQTLGTVVSDRTAPVVSDVVVTRTPDRPTALAELAFTAVDPVPGVGFAGASPVVVGPAGVGDHADWATAGASGPGRVAVLLPAPGDHTVTVRVRDWLGNRGESAPMTIHVPTLAEAADGRVAPPPSPASGPGDAPGVATAWAYREVRAFHARRGLRLPARLHVARTAAAWRRLLGPADAARYAGYTSVSGEVLVGPAATRGLERLWAERRRRATASRPAASRADLDCMTMGLAVLLHETPHATGPAARADVRGTRSGRAFEEGFTEAATLDLLPRLVADLDLPAPLRARLGAAVGRYHPPYRAKLAWARAMSAASTRSAAGSARARAWRIRVADTWGADRWSRLAAATGRDEAALRARAAGLRS